MSFQNINNRNASTCAIKEGSNIIFYINLSGFPLAPDAMAQMWEYAKELQPDAAEKMEDLKDDEALPDTPVPVPPYASIYNRKLSNYERVEKIQRYIDELSYNHTGLQFFDIRKDRPLVGLVDVAKKIIEDSLPIKCLEAVILSIYLTNEIGFFNNVYMTNNLEKFTIGFKTCSKNNIHRHVVLGIFCHVTGQFGSLGISRRSDLAYKPLAYATLTELLLDFIEAYAVYLHKVKRIKIGMPLPYSNRTFESIQWNGVTLNMGKKCPVSEWSKACEKHARVIRQNSMTTGLLAAVGNGGGGHRNFSLGNLKQQCPVGLKPRLNKSQDVRKSMDNEEIDNEIEGRITAEIVGEKEEVARESVSSGLTNEDEVEAGGCGDVAKGKKAKKSLRI